MMPRPRSWLVYGLLLAIWGVILIWQAAEHSRVEKSARATLINRAKDISDTVVMVMRSQRIGGRPVSKERMEATLKELLKPGELNAIALFNGEGDVVASVGDPIDVQSKGVAQSAEHWEEHTVTVMNLVDLGTNLTQDLEITNLILVAPRSELTNRPPPPPTNYPPSVDSPDAANTNRPAPEVFASDRSSVATTNDGTDSFAPPRRRRGPRFGRPPWMSPEQYKSVIEKRGVHSFVLVLSTASIRAISSQDLWLRTIIGALATVSVLGSGLAWRNVQKSSELQIRLVRASEMNTHLKEMNLAAAGLAHETRNPLNIIRGLAQMISKQEDASPEIRKKTREMTEEVDRVTAQLNEFINYSRPREVRHVAVPLKGVVDEVVRALNYDITEKNVKVDVVGDHVTVQADEALLRQALFNLVLNAVQAVDQYGEIQICAAKSNGGKALLEIRDNGPGVAPEHRLELFKPYFTTNKKGTGLGLAIVQQIVLAHGWEVECVPNQPKGAIFRLTHLKLVNR